MDLQVDTSVYKSMQRHSTEDIEILCRRDNLRYFIYILFLFLCFQNGENVSAIQIGLDPVTCSSFCLSININSVWQKYKQFVQETPKELYSHQTADINLDVMVNKNYLTGDRNNHWESRHLIFWL